MYMFLLHMWVFLKMGFPKPSLSIQFHAWQRGYSAGTFAAVAPWFGLPLLGYGLGAQFELVRYTKDGARCAAVVEMEDESNIAHVVRWFTVYTCIPVSRW